MARLIKLVDPVSEYQAKVAAVEEEGTDSLRCTHPAGPIKCKRLVACSKCPFAELLELEPQAA